MTGIEAWIMVREFGAMLGLAFSALLAQEQTESGVPDYTDLLYEKPDTLPLTASAAQECPVGADVVRESAERAITRAGVKPIAWPTLQGDEGWFGLYVALECEEREIHLHVSFIDSINGTIELYGGLHDNPAGRTYNHDHQRFSAAGLAPPPPHGGPHIMLYPSFVEHVVERMVSRFLEERFEL
jgi:hypothetical protein